MTRWDIFSEAGLHFGVYEGDTEAAALASLYDEAGYLPARIEEMVAEAIETGWPEVTMHDGEK